MLKKVILAIVILIGLVILGTAIFIATFDVDKYRPMIAQKIGRAIGKKITFGHLSLAWRDGITFEVKDLKLYRVSTDEKPLAELESAMVVVRPMPLLNKEVQVTSVILSKPHVKVEYGPEGILAVKYVRPASSHDTQSAGRGSIRVNFPLSIDLIHVKDGEFLFGGRSGRTQLKLTIKNLNATIKNFSFTKPFLFDTQMMALSGERNISASGRFQLSSANQAATLKNFILKSDLSLLDLEEAAKVFPVLETVGLKDKLEGSLQLDADLLSFNRDGIASAKARIRLRDGKVSLKQFRTPIEHLNMDVMFQKKRMEIYDVSANFAEGDLKISGVVDQPMTVASSEFHAAFRDLALDSILPASAPGVPGFTGRLTVDIQGKTQGTHRSQISRSFSGHGRLMLKEGVILNYNILRVVTQKISRLSLVGEQLLNYFPGEYKAKLDEPNTILEPVNLLFKINSEKINFDDLLLATDLFTINGAGQLGLDRSIDAKAAFHMNSMLSEAFIHAAPEIQLLADSKSRIEIPLTIRGVLPNLVVLPDIEYLTSKIMMAKARELVMSYANKHAEDIHSLESLLGKKLPTASTLGDSPVSAKDN